MKVSQSETSGVAKTINHYDETGSHEDRHRKGKEDPESPLLQRISSLELPASEMAA
jgi:hypothetical protein